MWNWIRANAGAIGALAAVALAFAAMLALVYQINSDTRQEIRMVNQTLSDKIDDVERRLTNEIRQEIRRSNRELLISLGNHHHDDGSPPVFTIPPGIDRTSDSR